MRLKCSLCSKNCFFSLLPTIFFQLPITRTLIKKKVRVVRDPLGGSDIIKRHARQLIEEAKVARAKTTRAFRREGEPCWIPLLFD